MAPESTNKCELEPALSAGSELGGAPGYANDEKLRAEIAFSIKINRCSAENGSNTPDFILAEYLTNCLAAFDAATARREKWYGYTLSIGYKGPVRTDEDSHTGAHEPQKEAGKA